MRRKSWLADCWIMPMQHMRVRLSVTLCTLSLGLFFLASPASDVWAATSDDAFVAGYATAVLEREFNVSAPSLRVKEGLITVTAEDLAGADREKVVQSLSSIRGVLRVVVLSADPASPDPASTIALQSPAADRGPGEVGPMSGPLPVGWLPEGHLFSPLLADPRWPHFSASYEYYPNDKNVRSVGAVSFGETIPLYRTAAPMMGQVELGLQAGVFAIFDLEAKSRDLVNADYFVAALAAYRTGNVSALARLFHQSSHLGDEFLLRTRIERVNLSYEGVDLKLSYDFPFGFRLYGGGRVLVDQEPSDLKPWATQAGVEFRSPQTFWGGSDQTGRRPRCAEPPGECVAHRCICASGHSVRGSAGAGPESPGTVALLQWVFPQRSVLQAEDRVYRPRGAFQFLSESFPTHWLSQWKLVVPMLSPRPC